MHWSRILVTSPWSASQLLSSRSNAVIVTGWRTSRCTVFSLAQLNTWDGRYQVVPSHQYPPRQVR